MLGLGQSRLSTHPSGEDSDGKSLLFSPTSALVSQATPFAERGRVQRRSDKVDLCEVKYLGSSLIDFE